MKIRNPRYRTDLPDPQCERCASVAPSRTSEPPCSRDEIRIM